MLKTKKLNIKLNAKTIRWYWERGYKGTTNDIIRVKVVDLKPTSHYKVECVCDNCSKKRMLPYKSYIQFTSNNSLYYCHKCCMIKKETTCMTKYGVKYSLQAPKVRKKIRDTCLEKYGVGNFLCTSEYLNNIEIKNRIRRKNLLSGRYVADSELTPFLQYKRKCRKLTDKNKALLYAEWDGYDYYDGEYIKKFSKLHFLDRRYPTIDHKVSILHGFRTDMSVEDVCAIDNLCITKRFINCSKRAACHDSYSR